MSSDEVGPKSASSLVSSMHQMDVSHERRGGEFGPYEGFASEEELDAVRMQCFRTTSPVA